MAITRVENRTRAFYEASSTTVTRSFVGPILEGDLLVVVAFGRSAMTPPPGFSLAASSPVIAGVTQRTEIYYKIAALADVRADGALLSYTVTQASDGRCGTAWAIYRSSLGPLTLGTAAVDSSAEDQVLFTSPVVNEATSHFVIAAASNIFAFGDQPDPVVHSTSDAAWNQMNTVSDAAGINRLGFADLISAGGASPALVWDSVGQGSGSNWWTGAAAPFLEVTGGIIKGIAVDCRLNDGTTAAPDQTGLSWAFYDDPSAYDPETPGTPDAGGASAAILSGLCTLNINAGTSLAIGQYGLLILYKRNATTRSDSIAFIGEVPVVDIQA